MSRRTQAVVLWLVICGMAIGGLAMVLPGHHDHGSERRLMGQAFEDLQTQRKMK